MSTLSELLAEHTELPGGRRRAPAARRRRVAAAGRHVVRRLPAVGPRSATDAPERRPQWLCVAQARPTTAPPRTPRTPSRHARRRAGAPAAAAGRRRAAASAATRSRTGTWRCRSARRRSPCASGTGRWRCSPATRTSPCPACPARWRSPTSAARRTSARWSPTARSRPARPSPGADTSPRAGDGVIRLDAHGLVAYASPNALSAYHRMGHASDLVGLSLAAATRALVARPVRRRRDRRPHRGRARRAALAADGGRGPRGASCSCGPCRCGRGATRRARWCSSATSPTCAAATRPCCQQGRDDPGDPPPREEQPADGRRPAAPAGPAHGDPGGPPGARGERPAGQLDRVGARVALRRRSPSSSTSTSWSTRCCRRSATAPRPSRGPRCAARAASAPCRPRWPRRSCWCSPSWCTTRWRTPSTPGTTGEVCVTAERSGGRLDVVVADDGDGHAARLRPGALRGARPADRAHAAGLGAGLLAAGAAAAGRRERRPSSACHCGGVNLIGVTADTVAECRRRGPTPELPAGTVERPRARCRVVSGCRARGGGVSGCS